MNKARSRSFDLVRVRDKTGDEFFVAVPVGILSSNGHLRPEISNPETNLTVIERNGKIFIYVLLRPNQALAEGLTHLVVINGETTGDTWEGDITSTLEPADQILSVVKDSYDINALRW